MYSCEKNSIYVYMMANEIYPANEIFTKRIVGTVFVLIQFLQ